MPAKKRGKGLRFTRKKQHKSQSSPPSSSGEAGTLVVVKKAARKPPKTPQVQPREGVDSATSSKRKGKEISSVPTRVSPRLLAIRTRKMSLLENGSLVPVSANNNTVDQGVVTQPPADDHIDDALDENENENIGGSNNTSKQQKKGRNGVVIRGKRQEEQLQEEEVDSEDDDDDALFVDDDLDELERQILERGTGPVKQLKISVTTDMQEVEEDYTNHAVLMYFSKTGGETTITRSRVKEWIYSQLGGKETIGAIRYCKDFSRGFFFVYFERIAAREKALVTKPKEEDGVQVIVFPCAAMVNNEGEQLTPRMIVLPGLPFQYLPVLPDIGKAFGTYIGCVGALDPDADLNEVRAQNGWESASNSTVTSEPALPRIVVMIPPEVKLPHCIELPVRAGVSRKQRIYEQLPHQRGEKRGAKRVAATRKKLKA